MTLSPKKPPDCFSTEKEAICHLADELTRLQKKYKAQRIGILSLRSLSGEIIPMGRRISNSIQKELEYRSKWKLADKDETHPCLSRFEREIFHRPLLKSLKNSPPCPLDAIITGYLVPFEHYSEIYLRMVLLKSRHRPDPICVRIPPAQGFIQTSSPALAKLYKNSPHHLDDLNKTYYTLLRLNRTDPLLFLLCVINNEDIQRLQNNNRPLARELKRQQQRILNQVTEARSAITFLRKHFKEMKTLDPDRYEQIVQLKMTLILK